MFHVEEEVNVDVELLAECGQIAQRLRSLEQAWRIDLKDLQKKSLCNFGKPPLATTISLTHKLNDIWDINENTTGAEDSPDLINHLRYLEETVIKIHHQQELLRHTTEHHNRIANAAHKKVYYSKSNMNYSASSGNNSKNNNINNNGSNDLTTSPQATSASMAIHEHVNTNTKNESNNVSTTTVLLSSRDNKKKIFTVDDDESTDDDDKDQSKTTKVKLTTTHSNKQSQNIYHQHQQQQQQLSGRITNDDLKLLLRELKRKVDYTEKMNWLCLSNRPKPPPYRKSSLPKHSYVKTKFLEICHTTLSDDVKAALRLPSFDSYDWEDYEILHLMETMFYELNFIEKFHISSTRLREWLYEVYKHYNDVPFHNFRHCFCVSQMMYAITWQTNLMSRLGDMDCFILLVSCICHDLDHPGYNNVYQINAKTELALRYNDISPLENHHCSIAFRLLEYPDCDVLENVTKDMYKEVREGIIRCILATDMARHNEILTQFREIIPIFDYSNNSHKNLLCMVLIKVADISNEARPMEVAEPWLDRLLQEFFAQSAAEKLEGLPVTPFMDPDKVSKPGSQVRFIGLVLLPLFEALGELLPELVDFIVIPVRVALDFYKRLNDAQQRNRKSLVENEGSSDGGDEIIPRSHSGISVRSRRSIPSQKSASRNSVDEEPMLIAAELHDLPEGSESGDSETATEVDVAEKTSKFKVDTESRNKFNMQMVHRKGHHRDKRPSMVSEIAGRMRGSYGNILQNNYNSRTTTFGSNRAISLDHYSNHRRMSDGIQTVTSDSTVYYHQRLHDQDILIRQAAGTKMSSSSQGSSDVKLLVSEEPMVAAASTGNNSAISSKIHTPTMMAATDISDTNRVQSSNINNNNNNNNNNESSNNKNNSNSNNNHNNNNNSNNNLCNSSKPVKSKLSSSVNCSSSPKSIITRLRQLTGRLSFSFDKESRRMSSGTPQTIINKTSPMGSVNSSSKNNNMMPNICCNTKGAATDVTSRNRAYSLDVPATRYNYNSSAGSSYNGSHKSLSSNRNDEADDSTDNNSVFASKKMSAEVEPMDI
ncbi:hypothetical protein ACKWTF_010227 [Chironomus riparius]